MDALTQTLKSKLAASRRCHSSNVLQKMSRVDDTEEINRIPKVSLLLLAIAIVVAWLFFPCWGKSQCTSLSDRALLGDSYGSLNSLFSGLSLAGVIVAIIFQSKELALQRKELAHTREELSRTAEANEASAKALVAAGEFDAKKLRINALSSLLESETAKLNAHQQYLSRRQGSRPGSVEDSYSPKANKRIKDLEDQIRSALESLEDEVVESS